MMHFLGKGEIKQMIFDRDPYHLMFGTVARCFGDGSWYWSEEGAGPVCLTTRAHHTLPPENLLGDSWRIASSAPLRKGGRRNSSVTSRCGSLLRSLSADVCASDDVIAF